MRFVSLSIIFLIFFMGSALAETSINTNSIQTSAINTSASNLDINTVTDFTGNSVKGVNNLFFSSKTFIVQESDGDDIVFQLDNSSGARKNFLTLDNSAFSVVLGVPLSMSSNQISDLADPTDPQDAATMSWVNENDDIEPDTNASTECGSEEVLTGAGCVARYSANDDSDSALGNEGANDLSFDTGTGTLTLDRVNQGSLTQNLDGRYATSDSNTQLDDQPAQSSVDFGENILTNVDSIRDNSAINTLNFDGNNNVEIPNGDLFAKGVSIEGNAGRKVGIQGSDRKIRSWDIDAGGDGDDTTANDVELMRIGYDNDGGSSSAWNNMGNVILKIRNHYYDDGGYVEAHISAGRYDNYDLEITEATGDHIPKIWVEGPVDTGINSNGRNVKYWKVYMYAHDYMQYDVQVTTNGKWVESWSDGEEELMGLENYENNVNGSHLSRGRYISGSWSVKESENGQPTLMRFNEQGSIEFPSRNVDMNTNQIQNAEVDATEGLKIPVGQDAY